MTTSQNMGLAAFLVAGSDGLWRVQVGAFHGRANAENHLSLVKGQGLDAFIVAAA